MAPLVSASSALANLKASLATSKGRSNIAPANQTAAPANRRIAATFRTPTTFPPTLVPTAPQTTSAPPPTAYSTLATAESPFIKPRKRGFHHLAKKVLDRYAHFSQIKAIRKHDAYREFIYMLATTDDALLDVIIHGNLQLKQTQDARVKDALDYLHRRAHLQPGIYMLELVDRVTNQAPSPNQLEQILQYADDYVEKRDPQAALLIDQYKKKKWATLQDMKNGDRAYMLNTKHRTKYREMRAAMKRLWANYTAAEMDLPMRQPMREVGYSKDCVERLQDHYAHRSSNYLMGLFDAICRVFASQLGGDFTIVDKGDIIYLAWRDQQPMLAETLYTALAQADTGHGRGFCHADPGDTATSHYKESSFKWSTMQQDVLTTSPFLRNINAELRIMKRHEDAKIRVEDLRRRMQVIDEIEQNAPAGHVFDSDDDMDDEPPQPGKVASVDEMVEDLKTMFRMINGMHCFDEVLVDLDLDD
ncbi:uncharacterized protein LTR77_003334 [Saxophila tyrrhenica]|uniref:Uncharacterized protein n=1 Tax=Saxophila tyrrhenica TaxID=1690608 RepID=A0AAV9PKM4_9PEZI|nr:hypothetical protein LTR77_003334 [Saxophila tyrrhenica]